MPPRVSILTVCRNDAGNLPRCLEGIAAQDWPDLEHVVQDGASTDGTLELLRAHAKRVDLKLVSEPDRGIHDAFVRGLRRTSGDIVGFSWADEALLPGAVRRAVEVLEARPELGGLYGTVIETDGDGRDQRVRAWPDWSFGEVFLYRLVPPICAAFFRRRPLEERFLPAVEIAGDCFEWVLWVTAGSGAPILRIPEPLTRYAQREGQLSRRPDEVDGYPARLTRAIDALSRSSVFPPELVSHCAAVKANVHLSTVEWFVCEFRDRSRGMRHLEAALACDRRAVRNSAIPWACARALLSRGDGDWVIEALDRMAEAGVFIPGASLLRALADAQRGDTAACAAAETELVQIVDAPALSGMLAGVIARLRASGHMAEAERSLELLRWLGDRTPSWRLTLAAVLADIERFEEAFALVEGTSVPTGLDSEWRALRLRLELALCTRSPGVRSTIGELAGRDEPIEQGEAAAIAKELARLLTDRSGIAPGISAGGLAVVAALVEVEAKRRGFDSLAREVGTIAAPLP